MDLRTAVQHVWDDVADNVYQFPTVHEAVRYARQEMSSDELAGVYDGQLDGMYDDVDMHGAYVALQNASDDEVNSVLAELV